MEKLEVYRPDEETIEAWLEKFEIRLQCHGITAVDKKKHWCQALIGEAGQSIINSSDPGKLVVAHTPHPGIFRTFQSQ